MDKNFNQNFLEDAMLKMNISEEQRQQLRAYAASQGMENLVKNEMKKNQLFKSESDLMQMQQFQIAQQKEREARHQVLNFIVSEDIRSNKNVCTESVDVLEPTFLLDIPPGQVSYGKILWLTIVSEGFSTSSANFVVKDQKNTASICCLYNMTADGSESLEKLNQAFPIGMKFGLKQPYLKISESGQVALRNDNPGNFVLWTGMPQNDSKTENPALISKEKGNEFFKNGDFNMAIHYYEQSNSENENDHNLKKVVFSNIAQCHLQNRNYQ